MVGRAQGQYGGPKFVDDNEGHDNPATIHEIEMLMDVMVRLLRHTPARVAHLASDSRRLMGGTTMEANDGVIRCTTRIYGDLRQYLNEWRRWYGFGGRID